MPNIDIPNTYKYFEELEVKLIKQMQAILARNNRNASHKLERSLNDGAFTLDYRGSGRLYYTFELPDIDGKSSYGKYVLDSRRRITKKGPGPVIQALMKWMLQKHIPIGGGKMRTPVSKTYTRKSARGGKDAIINEKKMANVQAKRSVDKREAFAWAIWKTWKKNKRVWAPSTNFLKPYQNIWKSPTFKNDLTKALKKDGITIMRRYSGSSLIKIKM